MRWRVPVLVARAECVLDLSFRNCNRLAEIYDGSVSLPEFMLGEVLFDGFGDENEQLIAALLQPGPTDYIKERVKEYAQRELVPGLEEADPVRAVIQAQVDVTTPGLREV